MRIIPEDELAPDDNPCEDCNRIRVLPIVITDAEWDEIYESYDYPEMWDKRFKHNPNYPFSKYLKELMELKQEEVKHV